MSHPPCGSEPTRVRCPSCHADVLTNLKHEAGPKTHIIAVLLCLFLCWPCICVPYCINSCKSANHYCPNCGAYIGTYRG